MLTYLGIVAAGAGLYAGRNSRYVKAMTNGVKNIFIRSNIGKNIVLSNAEENIQLELNKLHEQLENEQIDLDIEKKELESKQDNIEFLKFAMVDSNNSEQENNEYAKELEAAQIEYDILGQSLEERYITLQEKTKQIKEYEENGEYSARLTEALRAKLLYTQNNQLKASEIQLKSLLNIGKSSLTSKVVNSISSGRNIGKLSMKNRMQAMQRYKEQKKS